MKRSAHRANNLYKVLLVLYNNQITINNNTFCPITQTEVGKALSMSRPTVIKIFKELKKYEYIMQDKTKVGRYLLTNKAIEYIKSIKE